MEPKRGLRWMGPACAILGILAGCASSPESPPTPAIENEIDRALATITQQDLYDRIAYLASDTLKGRNTPSPGLEAAASYVADQLRTFGLRPAGDSGGFIQRWPYTQTRLDLARTSLQIMMRDTTVRPELGRDYFVIPGREPTASGELHWGGLAEPGMTVSWPRGRIPALMLAGSIPDSSWNARFGAAFAAAMSTGAPALVVVLGSGFDNALFRQFARQVGADEAPLYLIGIRYGAVVPILARTGIDTTALRTGQAAPSAALDGVTLSVAIGRATQESRPPNVVGIMAGSDPELREEYIVLSSHIDHVGVGRPDATGDSIFNGADDDASGAAVMLEVAQAFAGLRGRPARSIVFLAVSGEEKGLLGSAWFTEHLPVPVENIIANINLDMVGRNSPDTVVAIGQAYSSLGDIVQDVARAHPALGLTVAPDLWPEEQLFFRSDHFNFAKVGVPALFLTTGLHAQYHQPSDEVELIDLDKVTRVAQLLFHFTLELATRADRPVWTENGRREIGSAMGR